MSDTYIPNTQVETYLEEIEIRNFMVPDPLGPVLGYQMRLLLRRPPTDAKPAALEWTPRVFLRPQDVRELLRILTHYLATEGHDAPRSDTGGSAH